MYRYIVTSPGQGVQKPGMLDPWLGLSHASEVVAHWSDLIGADLVAASRDESALRDTSVAQPVIIAAALLSLRLVRDTVELANGRALFAGHSVGELAAAAGAGYLSDDSAMVLADARGRAMSLACMGADTGMAAVVPAKRAGASDEEIEASIHEAGLAVANHNGSHQFVVAGPLSAIEAFAASRPEGMRVMKLDVAGAFHTCAMAGATAPFAQALQSRSVSPPSSPMLSNRDGEIIGGPEDFKERLTAQISSPVRWDRCSAAITAAAGPDTLFVELAPGGTLTRLVERSGAGLRTVALRTPEDVDQLTDQLV